MLKKPLMIVNISSVISLCPTGLVFGILVAKMTDKISNLSVLALHFSSKRFDGFNPQSTNKIA